MNQAGQRLLGEHDFRNFCKMDVNNGVTNYVRNIELVKAEEFSQDLDSPGYSVCVVTVKVRLKEPQVDSCFQSKPDFRVEHFYGTKFVASSVSSFESLRAMNLKTSSMNCWM